MRLGQLSLMWKHDNVKVSFPLVSSEKIMRSIAKSRKSPLSPLFQRGELAVEREGFSDKRDFRNQSRFTFFQREKI